MRPQLFRNDSRLSTQAAVNSVLTRPLPFRCEIFVLERPWVRQILPTDAAILSRPDRIGHGMMKHGKKFEMVKRSPTEYSKTIGTVNFHENGRLAGGETIAVAISCANLA